METILNFIKTDNFYIALLVVIVVLFILYIIDIIKLVKLKKKYNLFMKKLGNGENIKEALDTYMKQVEDVQKKNEELKDYYEKLSKKTDGCIQKVGLVRYNAFKDTGSDLSFTLALLDAENTGVVLNGIYSRDMSNIYSKPIESGISTYTLSIEEKKAIEKAMNQ